MEFLRTPDERFENLPDFPFAPRYCEVRAGTGPKMRIHYVDEGPRDAPPVLMLHGEPAWSFLYRGLIPILAQAGVRAVALDLPGFGRSDKPASAARATYSEMTQWVRIAIVLRLELQAITLVGHGLGGLLGLRLVAEHPRLFSRVVAANCLLPTPADLSPESAPGWHDHTQAIRGLDAGAVVQRYSESELPAEVTAAYDAPFPTAAHRMALGRLSRPFPDTPRDPAAENHRRAWQNLRRWKGPALTVSSGRDPITRGGDTILQEHLPGARNQSHITWDDAGHYLQEDKGEELAHLCLDFIRKTPG